MRLYIHAGTFKTGSSAIQNYLYTKQKKLLKNRILYPEAGISKKLSEEVGFRHSGFVYGYGFPRWERMVNNLKNFILLHQPEKIILSSEAWSKPGASESLFALIEQLDEFNLEEIVIAFVVRNAFDYSISHYREFVRRWGVKSLYNDYTQKKLAYFDYNKLFLPFTAKKNVNVRFFPYNEHCVENILNDMKTTSRFSWRKTEQKRVNTSLSALDIEVQRKINVLHGGKGVTAPLANELLAKCGLKQIDAKIVESEPPSVLSELFTSSYKKEFTALTGLDVSLLEVSSSSYFSADYLTLETLSPLIDQLTTDFYQQHIAT